MSLLFLHKTKYHEFVYIYIGLCGLCYKDKQLHIFQTKDHELVSEGYAYICMMGNVIRVNIIIPNGLERGAPKMS